jgi:hypothetical protein
VMDEDAIKVGIKATLALAFERLGVR